MLQVKSVIADFAGKNHQFKKYLKQQKTIIVINGFKKFLDAAVLREG